MLIKTLTATMALTLAATAAVAGTAHAGSTSATDTKAGTPGTGVLAHSYSDPRGDSQVDAHVKQAELKRVRALSDGRRFTVANVDKAGEQVYVAARLRSIAGPKTPYQQLLIVEYRGGGEDRNKRGVIVADVNNAEVSLMTSDGDGVVCETGLNKNRDKNRISFRLDTVECLGVEKARFTPAVLLERSGEKNSGRDVAMDLFDKSALIKLAPWPAP